MSFTLNDITPASINTIKTVDITKKINTIGKKWATFQAINFNTASQPFYVQITPEGTLLNKPIQYTDTKTFRNWLQTGLENRVNPVSKAKYFKF